jgi:serine protease Do
MSGHEVTRGYIGATVQSLSPDLSGSLGLTTDKGALIDQVSPGGPAERAGLHMGDIVTSVNGVPIKSSTDLTQQVALARPGEAIRLGVLHDGQAREIAITSGLRPSESALAANAEGANGQDGGLLGLQVAPDARGGLVIEGVSPDSDAAQRGLRQGDVIVRAGARSVQSAADLAQAVAAAKASGRPSVPLLVARGGQRFYVPVRIDAG